MIDNFNDENLTDEEAVSRAMTYYRSTQAALADYSRHCNRVPEGAQPDAYQDTQSNILDVLGFVLGFDRNVVLRDIREALAGGETDD